MSEPTISRRTYTLTYITLLILTAATTAAHFIDLGPINTVLAVGFGIAKAVLIALFFMHLIASPSLTRVIAIGALIWFLILMSLTLADYFTRGWVPAPGK
jgi:cytochrome c oxidase subunit 4